MYSLCSLVNHGIDLNLFFFSEGGGEGGCCCVTPVMFSLYEVLKGSTEKNSRRSRPGLLEGCPIRRLFSAFFCAAF